MIQTAVGLGFIRGLPLQLESARVSADESPDVEAWWLTP